MFLWIISPISYCCIENSWWDMSLHGCWLILARFIFINGLIELSTALLLRLLPCIHKKNKIPFSGCGHWLPYRPKHITQKHAQEEAFARCAVVIFLIAGYIPVCAYIPGNSWQTGITNDVPPHHYSPLLTIDHLQRSLGIWPLTNAAVAQGPSFRYFKGRLAEGKIFTSCEGSSLETEMWLIAWFIHVRLMV